MPCLLLAVTMCHATGHVCCSICRAKSTLLPTAPLHGLQVVDAPEEDSRLLLCEATAVVMRQCFSLLGITPLYRI
jgi:hypothetical protein